MKTLITILLGLLSLQLSYAQPLQPGFSGNEYRELLRISVVTATDSAYARKFDKPTEFHMVYQSKPMGLDNSWDLWTNENGRVVISLRGTTMKAESWLANFYAAMTSAEGQLKVRDDYTFHYKLSDDPCAAVHVGWLLSLAHLAEEIRPAIDSCYTAGTRDFLIMGHSQGGGISYLLASHLAHLQSDSAWAKGARFKTYISAGPKPGNLYFAYDFENRFREGWAFNVVNTADWVPEVPVSIQTLNDFNQVNPFANAKQLIKKQKFPKNLAARHIFNQLDKPTRKAQRNYEKYLGKMTSKIIKQHLPGFEPPAYYPSNHYVRTGATIVLVANQAYLEKFPHQPDQIFCHHTHDAYLWLIDRYEENTKPKQH